ncbi:MAG: glycosyltransferase family 4 protein [Christensenellaceae bacterium]|nr:glycosyltransferase family 4 protein [Christensenellaceae bacterium]
MKIAVVYQHYYPEPFRLTDICEELVRRGHTVTVYTGLPNYPHGNIPKKYKWFKNRLEYRNGVKIIRTFEIGRKKGKLGLAINYVSYTISSVWKSLFAPLDFDVIFAYSTSPILMSLPGLVLKKRSNKKMLLYIMDIWPACLSAMNVKETSLLYRFMRRVSKYVYKNCDMLTYSSKSFKTYMQDVHKINMPEENYTPQFADALFENIEPENKTNKEEFTFVFAGNIGKMQNVDVIIKAADILRDYDINWKILGDGSDFDRCRQLVDSLGLEYCIDMPGRLPVESMPIYYSNADALIVTMKNDPLVNSTLPGKIQSYMAFGKPILGAINGETANIIAEADCGLCSEAENPEAFAKIILEFINMPVERKKELANNSKNYYIENFTMKLHIDRLERQLLSLCNK